MPLNRPDFRAALAPIIRARGVRALARQVGIEHSAISRWLSKEQSLSVDLLEQMLAVLEVRVYLEAARDRRQGGAPKAL